MPAPARPCPYTCEPIENTQMFVSGVVGRVSGRWMEATQEMRDGEVIVTTAEVLTRAETLAVIRALDDMLDAWDRAPPPSPPPPRYVWCPDAWSNRASPPSPPSPRHVWYSDKWDDWRGKLAEPPVRWLLDDWPHSFSFH